MVTRDATFYVHGRCSTDRVWQFGKFLLTEIAHEYSAVFLMEELEEVIRIGNAFYEAK